MGNYLHLCSQGFPKLLYNDCHDMQKFLKLSNFEIKKIIKNSNKNYDKYIKNNLCMNYDQFKKKVFYNKSLTNDYMTSPGSIQMLNHLHKRFKLSQ